MGNRDVVLIGGSAGAVAPLRTILAALPTDFPASVIVLLHMPTNGTGIFATIASLSCRLPTCRAEDGTVLRRGQVYVAQPNHHLLVVEGQLKLGSGPRENSTRPAIDPLLRSAAIAYGPRAIGVILSGMLNDGASGLAALKQSGGVALVQAPKDAEAPDLPLAALEATPVDLSAAAADLAAAIVQHVHEEPGPAITVPPEVYLEVEIAAGGKLNSDKLAEIAAPVPITCPDCGGVLSEMKGGWPLRFRCQVGHAYTGRVLLEQQESQIDEAMRVALRIIQERAELVGRMGRDAERAGRNAIAQTYQDRAAEYRAQADTLREGVLRSMQQRSAQDDEGAMVEAWEAAPGEAEIGGPSRSSRKSP
jgi:two-component system chemotaxis response regulator CheB